MQSANVVSLIESINKETDDIKNKLEKENLYDAQGAILRAKAKWVSQAEMNTKYFYALEKRNARNKTMKAMYDKSGSKTRNQGSILNMQAEFYSKLYSKDKFFKCDIKGSPDTQVSAEQKIEMDKDITLEEIESAIKTMARDKSPGLSGFSIDIYIVFWNKTKHTFLKVVQFAFTQKLLHNSTMILKKDRDLLYIKNWRPIILLNTDYKIVPKLIANRSCLILSIKHKLVL